MAMDFPEEVMMVHRDLFGQVDGRTQRRTQKTPQKRCCELSWMLGKFMSAQPQLEGGGGVGYPGMGAIANCGGERLENETSGKSHKLGMH